MRDFSLVSRLHVIDAWGYHSMRIHAHAVIQTLSLVVFQALILSMYTPGI